MNKAYFRDIARSIWKGRRKFLALMVITALGVTVLAGIYATVQNMYASADWFYDEQGLFDIRIQSTLGLTDEDVESLQGVPAIALADGGYIEKVYTQVEGARKSASLAVLSEQGLNMPYVLEGALPQGSGEIAVTREYADAAGKTIGDTLSIEEVLAQDETAGDEAPEEQEPPAEEEDEAEYAALAWHVDAAVEEETEAPTFTNTTFTITAIVLDPMDISNSNGAGAFRSTGNTDYSFFITADDANYDVYTVVYIRLEGLVGLNSFSAEYEQAIQQAIDIIEAEIKGQREQARYDAIMAEALQKIRDAQREMDQQFEEADQSFADAWQELEDAKTQLAQGEAELTQEEKAALQQLADARQQLEDGKTQLAQSEAELEQNAAQLAQGEAELEESLLAAQQQFAQIDQIISQAQAAITSADEALAARLAGLKGQVSPWPQAEWDALVSAAAGEAAASISGMDISGIEIPDLAEGGEFTIPEDWQNQLQSMDLSGASGIYSNTQAQQAALRQAVLATGAGEAAADEAVALALAYGAHGASRSAADEQIADYQRQKSEALQQLAQAQAELEQAKSQLEQGRQQLAQARAQLEAAEAQLNAEEASALRELANAWKALAQSKQDLAEGEAELLENEQNYRQQQEEAREKIADAYAQLQNIDMTEWYVQDRTSLDSYSSMKSDMESINSIGTVFPVVFLVVAVLISLTTMTRMVEEDRGLIGTYKAQGFSNRSIYRKYIIYAALACLLGGLLGDFFGFIVLPMVLSGVLNVLYVLPSYLYRFDLAYGIGGPALFGLSMLGATALACRAELRQTPASLMRPKAPRAGSRVFLERVGFIWNRLTFLNKVTLRNLFRYKKRLFMTVAGIMGCTALVLAGFAIRDSVTDLEPLQYEHIYQYDLLLVANDEDNEKMLALLSGSGEIADSLNVQVGSLKVLNAEGEGESVQLIVVPTGASLEGYINLVDTGGGLAAPGDEGVLLTQNAAEMLGLAPGDSIQLQTLLLDRYDTTLSQILENYLGNTVYIGQELYESLFGEYVPNAVLAHFSGSAENQIAYAESLLENDFILSSISTAALRADFAGNFSLINTIMYVLILLAAGLAFVVLFTLSSTNISERQRELATIKVLGFYNREVHAYVNKETLILTIIGIAAGLPVGRLISGMLTTALKMPSLYFAVSVHPASYALAALISFSFALVVNLITNRTLDRINMVEALKSVD